MVIKITKKSKNYFFSTAYYVVFLTRNIMNIVYIERAIRGYSSAT